MKQKFFLKFSQLFYVLFVLISLSQQIIRATELLNTLANYNDSQKEESIETTLLLMRIKEYMRRSLLCKRSILHEIMIHSDHELLAYVLEIIPWEDTYEQYNDNNNDNNDNNNNNNNQSLKKYYGLKTFFSEQDSLSNTPLCYACYRQTDAQILATTLAFIKKHEKKNKKDKNWLTRTPHAMLLQEIAYKGTAQKLSLLLTECPDPNLKDINNMSTLYCAATVGNVECIKLLLNHPRIQPNEIVGNLGLTTLQWTFRVLLNGKDTIDELYSQEISLTQDESGHETIKTDQTKITSFAAIKEGLLLLIQHPKIDLFAPSSEKLSLLALAAKAKDLDIINALLNREKNHNWRNFFKDKDKENLVCFFHFLIRFFDKESFLLILTFISEHDQLLLKELLLKKNNDNRTPLHLMSLLIQELLLKKQTTETEKKELADILHCSAQLISIFPEASLELPDKKDPERELILRGLKKCELKKKELAQQQRADLPPIDLSEWETPKKITKKSRSRNKNLPKKAKKSDPQELSQSEKQKDTPKIITKKITTIPPEELFPEQDKAEWELVSRTKKISLSHEKNNKAEEIPELLVSAHHLNYENYPIELTIKITPQEKRASLEIQQLLKNIDYRALKKIDNKKDWFHSFTKDVEKKWAPFARLCHQDRLTTKEQNLFYTHYGVFYTDYYWLSIDGTLAEHAGHFDYLLLVPSTSNTQAIEPLCVHRFFVPEVNYEA